MMNPQLIGQSATWLSIVNQLFETRMSQLLAPHHLTNGQFGILHHILRDPTRTYRISEIAKDVEVGQPAVTKAMAKFETLGLVQLTPDLQDRRVKIVRSTPKAQQMLMETRQSLGPDMAQIFAGFEDAELDQLGGYLKRIAKNLDQTRKK